MNKKILLLLGILPLFSLAIKASVPTYPLVAVGTNGTAGVAICYPSTGMPGKAVCYGYFPVSLSAIPPMYTFVYTPNHIYSAGVSAIVPEFPTAFLYGFSYSSTATLTTGNVVIGFGFFGNNELINEGSIIPLPTPVNVLVFGNNRTSYVYYIGVGTNPGYFTYSFGTPYNITILPPDHSPTNLSNYTVTTACFAPIINIVSPVNNSTFNAGQTFTLSIQNNLAQLGLNVSSIGVAVYLNSQLYAVGTFTSEHVGQIIPINITIQSPGTYNITVLVAYQYASGCVNTSEASIIVNILAPPILEITSIQPTTTVPYFVGYPIVSQNNVTVYFTLISSVTEPTQTTCTATATLVAACGPSTGSTSTSNSVTFTYNGGVYNGLISLNFAGLTQGVYDIQLVCNVGSLQLTDSQSILYAYNASTCNLYCQALGGYPGVGTCCGLTAGQALPSQVTGYPNATYYNSTKCSLEPVPPGKCVNNKDVPPPGYICLNSTTAAYVQYHCTVNESPIDPKTFGTIYETIVNTTTCPEGTFCSYGRCVSAPISPQLIINVTYPTQGQVVKTTGGSIDVIFSVYDNIESQVLCTIVSNNNIVAHRLFNVSTEYNISVPIQPGTNTLVISCVNVANVTNSTTITYTAQVGFVPQHSSECGIPYVCLSSTMAAVLNYSVVNGQCVYNITGIFPAMPGQYCFAGSLYNENQVRVPSLLYANACGPDGISIYQYALTPTQDGTATSMYLLQVAPYRCVLGNAVNQSQLASFNGMLIPVCMPNGSIAVYQIVYDNSTGRIYYQLQNIQSCSGTCIAGLCVTSSTYTIQPPALQSIIVPSNYTNTFPITFQVYSPYQTVYVTITYRTSSGTQQIYAGVVYSGQTVNLGLNLPQQSGTLTITIVDPPGLSSSYQYKVTVTPTNVTVTPEGPAPAPVVSAAPSAPAPGAPIMPTAAAIAAQAPLSVSLIFIIIMAIAIAVGYYLHRKGVI